MSTNADLTWQAATAANLLEARKKKGRIGSRKSRAGCLTCKARRIKCDEKHPECDRCTSSGRKCDGYSATAPKKFSHSLIGGQLSQSLGLEASERRTFDYFLSWIAPRFAGSMDRQFWCGQVLQLAQAEPVVTNALLAISTLYEYPQFLRSFYVDPIKASPMYKVTVPEGNQGFDVTEELLSNGERDPRKDVSRSLEADYPPHPSIVRPPLDQHHMRALRHYNRAIRAFKDRMQAGKATPTLALLSCVLFICIELLRDNVFGALSLYIKGLDLLKQMSTNGESTDQDLLKTIKLIFARLGVLVAVFGYPLDVPQEFIDISSLQTFASMEEARTSLNALMSESHAYIRESAAFKASLGYEEPRDPMAFDPMTIQDGSTTQSDLPILASVMGVKFSDAVTRLYMGCLPEKDEDVVTFKPDGAPSPLSGESSLDPRTNVTSSDTSKAALASDDRISPFMERHADDPPSGAESPTAASDYPGSESPTQNEVMSVRTLVNRPRKQQAEMIDISKRSPWWVPSTLLERQTHLERRLEQWYDAFLWTQGTDKEAASSLLMHYHVAFIWLTTRLSPTQMVFDHYTFHFEQILRLAQIFIDSKSTERTTFTFEIGVVPPLYFLITKCRIPSLRRKGLELILKAPIKECMFGSKSCAELAARLIAIEEEGLGLSPTETNDSRLPAEDARIQSYEILQDNIAARYEVRVTRYQKNVDGTRQRTVTDYPI